MHLRGLVAACLLCAVAHAGPVRFEWPTPDLIESVEVPEVLRAHGVPMKLQAVRVRHKPEEMMELYWQAFRRAGFYLPPAEHQVDRFRDPSLTALDPTHFISYTVIFQANRDGTTTLILGEANLALRTPEPEGFAPTPPLAEQRFLSHSEVADLISFRIAASEAEVKAFYDQAFATGQYEREEAAGEVRYRRGDEEIALQLSKDPAAGRVRVVLLQQHRPTDASGR